MLPFTASVRPLNRQTAVDNSRYNSSTGQTPKSWVCSLSNPCSLIHLLIRLRSREINDQALSLAKIHWRGWSLGTRLLASGFRAHTLISSDCMCMWFLCHWHGIVVALVICSDSLLALIFRTCILLEKLYLIFTVVTMGDMSLHDPAHNVTIEGGITGTAQWIMGLH